MFSKHTNAITKSTKSKEGYIVWSEYHNLPNKRVLFLTKDSDRNKTMLSIFSVHDFNTTLVEKTLENNWHLLCILPDGSILLNNERFRDNCLIKLCPQSLNVLSTQPWKHAYSAGAINNESFFIIKKDDDNWDSKNPKCSLVLYTWDKDAYVESSKISLAAHPLKSSSSISTMLSLGKNRYCSHFCGQNTSEFGVLIFDVNPDTNEVKEIGVIKPKAQHRGSDSTASGSLAVLPNGKLLTYHESNDNVQIWDTETLSCVKEWNWANIQKPKEFDVWCLKIMSLPDSIYLLVQKGEKFYLFDTDKLVMKPIELAAKVEYYGKHHILPSGQIIAFTKKDALSRDHHVNVMHLDLPEIMRYRKVMTESQHLVRLFFNRNRLPIEITNNILSYTLTPDAKEMLARKVSDSNETENNENQNCLQM
jgi:hypothetical protein